MPMDDPLEIDLGEVRCESCPIGRASGQGAGQFCPFIMRRHAAGEVLCLAGDPARYVWMVKRGVVGLGRSRSDSDQLDALRLPGGMIGIECMVRDTYIATARALSSVVLCGATRDGFVRWCRATDERLALMVRAALRDPLLVPDSHGGIP